MDQNVSIVRLFKSGHSFSRSLSFSLAFNKKVHLIEYKSIAHIYYYICIYIYIFLSFHLIINMYINLLHENFQ